MSRESPPIFVLCGVPLCVFSLLLGGCSSSPKNAEFPVARETLSESAVAPVAENLTMPITQLSRTDVTQTVEAGLSRFLSNFVTEGVVDEYGKFQGFRLIRYHEPQKFRGLGLAYGDVITAINGQVIERPEQAYAVFITLKTAPSLDISYLRNGRPMQLSLPIVAGADGPAEVEAPSGAQPQKGEGAVDQPTAQQPAAQASPSTPAPASPPGSD